MKQVPEADTLEALSERLETARIAAGYLTKHAFAWAIGATPQKRSNCVAVDHKHALIMRRMRAASIGNTSATRPTSLFLFFAARRKPSLKLSVGLVNDTGLENWRTR